MNIYLKQLKVKIKTLVAEARFIKLEEQKLKRLLPPNARWQIGSLTEHRKVTVRNESRCSLLAYGFLRGRPYRQMETNSTKVIDWDYVEKMVIRFNRSDQAKSFEKWHEEKTLSKAA